MAGGAPAAGRAPDAGRGFLEVVPQLPEGLSRVGGSAIRLGEDGAAAVHASRSAKTYITMVQVGEPISKLAMGIRCPSGRRSRRPSSTASR